VAMPEMTQRFEGMHVRVVVRDSLAEGLFQSLRDRAITQPHSESWLIVGRGDVLAAPHLETAFASEEA